VRQDVTHAWWCELVPCFCSAALFLGCAVPSEPLPVPEETTPDSCNRVGSGFEAEPGCLCALECPVLPGETAVCDGGRCYARPEIAACGQAGPAWSFCSPGGTEYVCSRTGELPASCGEVQLRVPDAIGPPVRFVCCGGRT
jgi:hypothetical protein